MPQFPHDFDAPKEWAGVRDLVRRPSPMELIEVGTTLGLNGILVGGLEHFHKPAINMVNWGMIYYCFSKKALIWLVVWLP